MVVSVDLLVYGLFREVVFPVTSVVGAGVGSGRLEEVVGRRWRMRFVGP